MNIRCGFIGSCRRLWRFVLLSIIIFSIIGCAEENISDLRSYVSQVKSRQKVDIEPLPEIKIVETFVFKREGIRDPFEPSESINGKTDANAANGLSPDATRHKEELESYSLDSLRMVGTVKKESVLWGLIGAADGAIHRVNTGNFMGRNYGKIIRIVEERIELLEIIPDGSEGWTEREASLILTE